MDHTPLLVHENRVERKTHEEAVNAVAGLYIEAPTGRESGFAEKADTFTPEAAGGPEVNGQRSTGPAVQEDAWVTVRHRRPS